MVKVKTILDKNRTKKQGKYFLENNYKKALEIIMNATTFAPLVLKLGCF